MTRRILVTGGNGQVGRELQRLKWPAGVSLFAPGRDALDLGKRISIERYLADHPCDAIINCAAYTAVDRAEDEVAEAYAANAFGPAWLAAGARKATIPIVHVSTDYVFGGGQGRPRLPDDVAAPTNVYGASKLAGEIAVLAANDRATIVRTAWIYSPFGKNFLKTMLRLAEERDEIGVVADQYGTPTAAHDLALALQVVALRMIDDDVAPTGIFHFVNGGEGSWADFASEIMEQAAKLGLPSAAIKPVSSHEYPTNVKRPADSRLNTDSMREAFGTVQPHWREATRAVIERLFDMSRDDKR